LSRSKQRILYFCGCQWPRIDGRITCHRATVAELVLSAAKKQSRAVEIVEWPGGYPGQINLNVAPQILAAVRKGRTNVQLEGVSKLAEIAATPWCSVATLHAAGEKLHRIVGPAFRQKGDWALPVLCRFSDPKKRLSDYQRESKELRRGWGLDLICSQL
jgi:hypothetical protein